MTDYTNLEKYAKIYNILNKILSVYVASKSQKIQLINEFESLRKTEPNSEVVKYCTSVFDSLTKLEEMSEIDDQQFLHGANFSPNACKDRSINIGGVRITVLYKTALPPGPRQHYIIESTTNDYKKMFGRFVLYKSSSDLGVIKLKLYGGESIPFGKPNDYVTSTLINMKLQTFIQDNDSSIPNYTLPFNRESYGKLSNKDKDIYFKSRFKDIVETKEHTNLLIALTKNPYVLKYFRTRKICNSSRALTNLSKWLYKFNIKCGRFNRSLEDGGPHFTSKDLAVFKKKHKLSVSAITNNVFLNINYITIFRIIAAYYKRYFEATTHLPTELFTSRVQIYDDPKIFTISTYELIVKERDNGQQFKYFYIKYFVQGFSDKEYTYPLFIVPEDSYTLPWGVYDCYVPSGLYFCKPLEYFSQCPIYNKKECEQRKVADYYFIGDLLSGGTIPPLGEDGEDEEENKVWLNQLRRDATQYCKFSDGKSIIRRNGPGKTCRYMRSGRKNTSNSLVGCCSEDPWKRFCVWEGSACMAKSY